MKKNNNKKSLFWISYSDLMTSLFFIVLVLFVVVVVAMGRTNKATLKQLEDIRAIQQSTEDLNKDYFQYRDDYKKYVLKIEVRYPTGEFELNKMSDDNKQNKLKQLSEAGREIKNFLDKHNKNQYILIIEGQASSDKYLYNYELSYQRALSLIRFWIEKEGINFGQNCEILISGSGDGKLDTHSMREDSEIKNQRFLIHILPKNVIENANHNK